MPTGLAVPADRLAGRLTSPCRQSSYRASRRVYRPPCCFILVSSAIGVLLRDEFQLMALDVETGRPVDGAGEWGLIFSDASLQPRFSPRRTPPLGVPQFELSAGHGLLLARMGCVASMIPEDSSTEHAPSHIIGWDTTNWKTVLRIEAPDGWVFEGKPVTDGIRIYSCMRQRIGQCPLYLAAFDRNTGVPLWQEFVAASETPGHGMIDEIHHASVDWHEGLLICCTQSGVIAAYTWDGLS